MNQTTNIKMYVFRVFVNNEMEFGNPLGIILDENNKINPINRQIIATKSGFSEVVFINNLDSGDISIFSPKKEIPFAGHALVGTAYFIRNILNKPIEFLKSKDKKIKILKKGDITLIKTNLKNTPAWNHEQISNVPLIESLSISSKKHTIVWTWINKDKGIIRARTFAPDWGIPEDEANGSGSMQLAIKLDQKLEIHHGKGSIIYANPQKDNFVELGGRIVQDKSRTITV